MTVIRTSAQHVRLSPSEASSGIIVVPTYNEAQNVGRLIDSVAQVCPQLDMLFVDDNSPDGTGSIVAERAAGENRIHLLEQSPRQGFARSYVNGMQAALCSTYPFIIMMDADLSHPVTELPRMLIALQSTELVIGSRYTAGGSIQGWALRRLLLSRLGTMYAQLLLGMHQKDLTSGFMGWQRDALSRLPLDELSLDGFALTIELKYLAKLHHLTIEEIPICFRERKYGESKLTINTVTEAIRAVARLRFIHGKRHKRV